MNENDVCHVRPHGINANGIAILLVPDKLAGAVRYTKQCFWINNSHNVKIFNDFI